MKDFESFIIKAEQEKLEKAILPICLITDDHDRHIDAHQEVINEISRLHINEHLKLKIEKIKNGIPEMINNNFIMNSIKAR